MTETEQPLCETETEQPLCEAQTGQQPCMPRKKLSLEQRKKLLEDTKKRLRLEQEARTRERIEQIEFERFDRLGIRLFNEYWTVEGPSDSQTELESFSDEEGNNGYPGTDCWVVAVPLAIPLFFTGVLPLDGVISK